MSKIDFDKISVHKTPKKSPGFLLWQVSQSWRSSIEKILEPLSLTHPQFVVLATLGYLTRNGEMVTQGSVGELAGLDPNTLSQVIRGLEKKGLVNRIPSSLDSRVKNPLLTEKGKALLKKALPAVEKGDEKFFSVLNSEDREKGLSIFQTLSQT